MLTLGIFVLLLGALSLAGFLYVLEPGSEGCVRYLKTAGKLLLYKYSPVNQLNQRDIKRLYRSTCTKRCHGKDVIETKPRTAMEWGQIVERVGQPERAGLTFNEKRTITEHLQRNFLSNVPAILPDHTMRFLKKHVWRLDFGDDDKGNKLKSIGWQVLFEDVDKHHRQGVLTFPAIDPAIDKEVKSLVLTISPKGMRSRSYQRTLPIPEYKDPPVEAQLKKAGVKQ